MLLHMDSPIRHLWQQKEYTCGAAAVAMILGITEKEAAKLAGTDRSGTHDCGAKKALQTSGCPVYSIRVSRLPLATIGWALEAQSYRWPLYLSLEFARFYKDSLGRKRRKPRHHAVVLHRGQLFDPGEVETLTIDSLGHLTDEGDVFLTSYLIVETP